MAHASAAVPDCREFPVLQSLFACLPILGLVALGFGFGKVARPGVEGLSAINTAVMYLFFPALLFKVGADTDWRAVFEPGFLLAFGGAAMLAFALLLMVLRRLSPHDRSGAIVGALSASYANTAFLGLPLAGALLGQIGISAAMLASMILLLTVVAAALVLLPSQDGRAGLSTKLAGVTFRNPLVVSAVLGIGWSLLRLPMPVPLHDMLSLLGGAATPCALISVGAAMAGARIAGSLAVWMVVSGKMVLQPALTALAAHLCGLPPVWTSAAVLLSALPTGAVPTLLARSNGVDPMGPAQASAITTLLSVAATPVVFALFPPV